MTKRAPSATAKSAPATIQESSRAMRALPFLIAVLILVLVAAYIYRAKDKVSIGNNSVEVMQGDARQMQNLIDRVSAVVSVQPDEVPSVATIEDIALVRAQNPILYRGAQNGDHLLVWSDKAVVYSASENKVLSVMPLIKDQEDIQYVQRLISALNETASTTTDGSVAASDAVITNPTVEVRNGTPAPGRARVMADGLKAAGFNTVNPVDATKKDYTETIIFVANSNIDRSVIQELQQELKADIVTELPGESSITSDIVVIVGG